MDMHLDVVALGMIAMIVPLAINRLKQWSRVPKWVLPWACIILGALGEAAYSAAMTTDGVTLSGLITGVLAGTAGLWGREARDQWVKARRRAVRRKLSEASMLPRFRGPQPRQEPRQRQRERPRPSELDPEIKLFGGRKGPND